MEREDDPFYPEPWILVFIGRPHVHRPLVRLVLLGTLAQPEGEAAHDEALAKSRCVVARIHHREWSRKDIGVAPAHRGARALHNAYNTTTSPLSVTAACLSSTGGWPIQPVRVYVGLK